MQPRLLNLREVAQILHVSRSFVYLLIRRRKLVAIRLGNALRVHPDDLEVYIHEKRLADATHAGESPRRRSRRS